MQNFFLFWYKLSNAKKKIKKNNFHEQISILVLRVFDKIFFFFLSLTLVKKLKAKKYFIYCVGKKEKNFIICLKILSF